MKIQPVRTKLTHVGRQTRQANRRFPQLTQMCLKYIFRISKYDVCVHTVIGKSHNLIF